MTESKCVTSRMLRLFDNTSYLGIAAVIEPKAMTPESEMRTMVKMKLVTLRRGSPGRSPRGTANNTAECSP